VKHIKRTIEISLTMLALLVALLVATSGNALPAAAQNAGDRVAVGQDLVIENGETVAGDVSVTNGDLTIYGTVDGKVNVVNGSAEIYGKVLGDVAVLTGGGVTLNESSSVGGNVLAAEDIAVKDNSFVGGSVTSLGGHVSVDSSATVKGSIGEMTNPMQAMRNFVQPGQFLPGGQDAAFNNSPFSRIAGLFSVGILSVLILLLSVGMTAVVPARVRTASATLQAEPGPSIVVGIIAAFLIFPATGLVAIVLTISVIGLILLPVLALALLGAFLFGFVTVSHWLCKYFHYTTRQDPTYSPTSFQAPTLIIEVLLGTAVILASTLIPLLFLPTWIAALMFLLIYSIACIGIGAAILSRFGTLAPPKQRHVARIIYPTPVHNHYGSSLPHNPQPPFAATASTSAEHTNTRPLGPTPAFPREE